MGMLQVVGQLLFAPVGAQTDPLDERFGCFLQFGEMILTGVQRIAYAFQHGTGAAGRSARARHARGKVGGGRRGLAIGLEEAGKGFGRARLAVGKLGQFHPVETQAGEDGIGGRFLQVRHKLAVALIGKGTHIDVESVGEGQQDPRRHRPLIAFQQVEIAGRQSQRFGSLGLGQSAFTAQAAQARAGKDLLEALSIIHFCVRIYKVTS